MKGHHLFQILKLQTNLVSKYELSEIYGKFGFPAMGVDGIAIGTIVARSVELLVCALYFLKKIEIPFELKDLKRVDPLIRRILFFVTLPIVAHEAVWSFGTSSGSMILGQLGKDAVAGYNVTSVLYDLFATVGNGFSGACGIVMGMTLGKGEKEKAIAQSRRIIAIALCMGLILGVMTLLIKDIFLGMYDLSNEAVYYARQFMNVICLIWPFSMLEMVTMVAILRAGGDGKTGFYTDIVVMWMICIPLASYLAFKVHAKPVFIVLTIKSIIILESIIGTFRVYTNKWVRVLTRS